MYFDFTHSNVSNISDAMEVDTRQPESNGRLSTYTYYSYVAVR